METFSRGERLEKIRAGILQASGDFKKSEMAEQIGCAASTVSTLISSRKLGQELQDRFEDWLREKGYWPAGAVREAIAPYPTGTPHLLDEIAQLLDGLAVTARKSGRCTYARLDLLRGGAKTLLEDLDALEPLIDQEHTDDTEES